MNEANQGGVTSVAKSFIIIDYLSTHDGEASINDISHGLNLNKSTVHRLLNAVREAGYVYHNPANQKYGISLKFYTLALGLQEKPYFLHQLAPYAKDIFLKYNECVTVAIRDLQISDIPKYATLYGFQPDRSIRAAFQVGIPSPSHCSSAGKCLLAFSKPSYIDAYRGCHLPQYTENTITSWEKLDADLALCRERGYSIDREEREIGLMGISVPLFSSESALYATLSMTCPTSRFQILDINEVVSDLSRLSRLSRVVDM